MLQIDGFQVATALDEPMLREIAARTDGTYFAGGRRAGAGLGLRLDRAGVDGRRPSTSSSPPCFAAVGALLLLAGVGLSFAVVRAGGVAMGVQLAAAPSSPCWCVPLLRRRVRLAEPAAAQQAVRYSSVALIRAAAPSRRRGGGTCRSRWCWPRSALLGVAAARPQVSMDVPISDSTIILALDVSGSMCSTDVEPNRLTAAQTAVREFVQEPGRRHPDRAGRVLRVRAARGGADHRARGAAAQPRRPHHRPGHGDRRGHAQVGRRDRRDRPGVAPSDPGDGHRRRPPRRRARPPGTYAPGDRRAAHRRRQHHAASSRSTPPRPRPSAASASTRSGSAPATRRRWSARPPSSAAAASRATAAPARRCRGRWLRRGQRPQLPRRRRGHAARGRRAVTGGQYFAADDAGRLQDVLSDLPRTVATPAARRRGERRAGGARRRADAGRPVGGGALVSGLVSAPSAAARAAGGRARSAR